MNMENTLLVAEGVCILIIAWRTSELDALSESVTVVPEIPHFTAVGFVKLPVAQPKDVDAVYGNDAVQLDAAANVQLTRTCVGSVCTVTVVPDTVQRAATGVATLVSTA